MTFVAALPADIGPFDTVKAVLTFVVPAPSGCNLACPFCYIAQREEEATSTILQPADYVKFVNNIADQQQVDAISIQGYEPLLLDAFIYTESILMVGQRLGIPTSLVTNGTLLRQQVPALSKVRLDQLLVSLDSADADIHDKQRGKIGAFADTLQGLKFAINVPVLKNVLVVTSILMPKKRNSLMGMPKLLSDLGIGRWVINALVKVGRDGELGGPVGERNAILDDLLILKAEADRHGIYMVVDDEFGRLSDEHTDEVVDINVLRIKRLVRPEGVYRLVPTGHCSKGADILKPIHDKTPVWDPKTDAGEFLASMSG